MAKLLFLIYVLATTSAEDSVTFFVAENTEPGFTIGNIATDSNILKNISEEERGNVRFGFLLVTQSSVYVVLNDVTGEMNTSNVMIDREKICAFSGECVVKFDVSARSGSFFAIVTVKIVVLDVNDNAPAFPNASVTLNISELETVGTEFRLDNAYDVDMWGNNSIQSYTIQQDEEVFELPKSNISDVNFILTLRLKSPLDRESKDKFVVRIIARDGGVPIREGVLGVNVNVIDENDNSPTFALPAYNVTIDENITPYTVILTLSASDNDIGRNGEVTYRLRERQLNIEIIKRLFAVNRNTGDIAVIQALTHESLELYEFDVEAVDNGDQPRFARTKVTVTVNDVQNNAPVITVNLLSPANIGFVEVSENETIGFFVVFVNVEDSDKGANGEFSCIISNSLFKLETYSGRGFKVVVNGKLDRESRDTHNVTITCSDNGTPKMTSSESFLVRIKDVNDNDPYFIMDTFTTELQENNPIMAVVTQVFAKDLDSGKNAMIEYRLHDEGRGKFVIDPESGIIYANQSFDRETDSPIIVFRVLAIDHGDTRRTGSATVSVTLTDVNDVTPSIIPARPEFRIMENLPSDTYVGFLYAMDKDSGDNGLFTFSFRSMSTKSPFILLPSGEIRSTEVLDREKQSRYELPVTVVDKGEPPLSSTHYVTIFIADDNDNVPKVTFPNDINDTVRFLYPTDKYNVVTTIAAYDIDEGENSSLSYYIVDGNQLGIFEIDPELGELSVKRFIDILQDVTVTLTIGVKDKGNSPLATNVTLHVQLIYANASVAPGNEDGGDNKYIIISVVVIVTTVAIAVAIVGIIVFLRTLDRNKKPRQEEGTMYSDSGISSQTDSQPEVDLMSLDDGKLKKKKEVSFSLDFSMTGLDGGRNVESSTDGSMYKQAQYYEGMSGSNSNGVPYSAAHQERIDSHMKAIKLQQYLWEAKSRNWDSLNTQVQQPHLGDSESETSRETITRDSGHGGSEDDVSTSSPVTDERRSFAVTDHKLFPYHQTGYNTQGKRNSLPAIRESSSVHYENAPPRPPAYRGSSNDNYLSSAKLVLKSLNCAGNNLTLDQTPPLDSDLWRDCIYNGSAPVRMRHDSCSSLRSDDGGSTTTSGSYTLDQDEIDFRTSSGHRDLVV